MSNEGVRISQHGYFSRTFGDVLDDGSRLVNERLC